MERTVIEIQTLHIKQTSNLCNLRTRTHTRTHTHTHTHTISMVGGEREFDFNVLSGCSVGVSQQINVSVENLIEPPNPAASSYIKLVLSGSIFPLRLYWNWSPHLFRHSLIPAMLSFLVYLLPVCSLYRIQHCAARLILKKRVKLTTSLLCFNLSHLWVGAGQGWKIPHDSDGIWTQDLLTHSPCANHCTTGASLS